MKSFYLLGSLFLFTIACRKSNPDLIDRAIIGKWTYIEYYIGIGGPTQWQPVTPANQTIEFKSNGSFVPSTSFLKGARNFDFVDSIIIKFQPAATSSGYMLMGHLIDSQTGELYLYPVNPACIEGCNNKFRRI